MTEKKLFIIILKYLKPLAKIDQYLSIHLDYLIENYNTGIPNFELFLQNVSLKNY